jgi:hypothetical protein
MKEIKLQVFCSTKFKIQTIIFRRPSITPGPTRATVDRGLVGDVVVKMSPPSSPAKKKEKDNNPDKPKRPMNGFMLFAKKYRLELIQQHPGKDNR